MRQPKPDDRRGFTLVELLVVITIIAILVGLLVPAVMSAVRSANNAATVAEINTLANALEDFKSTYGAYPPSRVILHEGLPFSSYTTAIGSLGYSTSLPSSVAASNWINGTAPLGLSASDVTMGELARRSAGFLRKMFPKALPPNPSASVPTWYDFNGNGQYDAGWIYLSGDECLVFFLGGIPSATAGMAGFSKNPANPFLTEGDPVAVAASGGNAMMFSLSREPQRVQWKPERLVHQWTADYATYTDVDGIPSYLDNLSNVNEGMPYAYFYAYNGAYDPNDVNFPEADDNGNVGLVTRAFRVRFSNASFRFPNTVDSPGPNPYVSGQVFPAPDQTGVLTAQYYNPTSFQIVSAGRDHRFGAGGRYDSGGNEPLPLDDIIPGSSSAPAVSPAGGGIRIREQDNLTNFHSTTLR